MRQKDGIQIGRKSPQSKLVAGRRAGKGTTTPDVLRNPMFKIADHQLLRRIGMGSYGEVWLAQTLTGSFRAVKVVHRRTFPSQHPYDREFAGLKRFEPISHRHRNWVRILQVGQSVDDQYFYYLMELADDVATGQNFDPEKYQPKTLRTEIMARGRLGAEETVQLGLELADALGELHNLGFIHRDIKPSNIIFFQNVPKLADIGLVTTADGGSSYVGTEVYMPPTAPSCPSADLYSLGKVLYEAAMGQTYPDLPTDLDQRLDLDQLRQLNKIIHQACSPEFAKRFQNAGEMRERLGQVLLKKQVLASCSDSPKPDRAEQQVRGIEAEGGAVTLGSKFYIRRPTDDEFHAAIARRDSIILVKGARQMGKSSLLARGLEQAREEGIDAAATDLQAFNDSEFGSLENFYLALANSLADPAQLNLDVLLGDIWDHRYSPNTNFDRYLRSQALGKLTTHLFWGLDEVDRLFTCPFGEEVFRLFRSWHNKRALDPNGPWARLSLAVAHATEASLFITDLNNSPFNVGTRLTLHDFNTDEVAELNRRYGRPLQTEAELGQLTRLVGGQPFLVRKALDELVTHKISITELEAQADLDDGLFADHLRRLLASLNRDKSLVEVVRSATSFYRLRSAGLLAGESERGPALRCQLYLNYFRKHLL